MKALLLVVLILIAVGSILYGQYGSDALMIGAVATPVLLWAAFWIGIIYMVIRLWKAVIRRLERE